MKRKAMLMGMAVMTGLPGWAMAKGSGKAFGEAQPHVGSTKSHALGQAEGERLAPGMGNAGSAESSGNKASEMLAQIKSMLRGVNYGVVTTKQQGNDWTMELLQSDAGSTAGGDPRLQDARPLGLALRLKF